MADDDIRGTVVDEDGNAVSDATVEVFQHDKNTVYRTTTDSQGEYVIDNSIISDGGNGPWHVCVRYQDASGKYHAFSYPHVDATIPSSVPKSAVAQYDARDLTGYADGDAITTWKANEGTDITGSGTYRSSDINGQAAIEFNGSSDKFDATQSTLAEPVTIYAVINPSFSSGTGYKTIVGQEDGSGGFHFSWNGSNWVVWGGSTEVAGSSTISGRRMLSLYYDKGNTVIRENDTQTASGDPGSTDPAIVEVGYLSGYGRYFEGDIGFIEIHDGAPSSGFKTREEEIIDDWGFSF